MSASGIQTAISRFVAAETQKKGQRYLYVGLGLSIGISGIFSILIYIFAPWIADHILKEPRTAALLRVMVYSLVPASIHSCFNGYYYGRKSSLIPSLSQISEQVVRVCGTFLIYFILLERELSLAPIHAVWGMVISELAGLFLTTTAFLCTSHKSYDKRTNTDIGIPTSDTPYIDSSNSLFHIVKTLGSMAIPLSLNHVLMTLSHALENLLLPQQLVAYGYTSDEALGHFGILTGMALSVIFFPSAITNSLSVLLLPRISETKAKGDLCIVLDTIKGAVCCGVALGSLCTFLFLLSGEWFGTYIFDSNLAGFYIRILSILCPFLYTASLLSSIANGLGHAALTLACNLSGCAIRILTIWIFVPLYGMYAYIISMIVAAVVTMTELILVVKTKCRT